MSVAISILFFFPSKAVDAFYHKQVLYRTRNKVEIAIIVHTGPW